MRTLHAILMITSIVWVAPEEPELPLCPTNVQYFPQTLPMHCRMPRSANYPMFPVMPSPTIPPLPSVYQSPPPDKQPAPIPFPIMPGLPGAVSGPMSVPMPMPMMPMQGPAHKLPVIVMPFYSPDTGKKALETDRRRPRRKPMHINKRRLPRYYSETETDSSDTDTSRDTSTDTSSSDEYNSRWWRTRRTGKRFHGKHVLSKKKHRKKNAFLTPILQYVTKDGYVIFEKKISENQAHNWLEGRDREINGPPREQNEDKEPELARGSDKSEEVTEHKTDSTAAYNLKEKTKAKPHRKAKRKLRNSKDSNMHER